MTGGRRNRCGRAVGRGETSPKTGADRAESNCRLLVARNARELLRVVGVENRGLRFDIVSLTRLNHWAGEADTLALFSSRMRDRRAASVGPSASQHLPSD
nr:hypothetical protein FNV92_31075 [Bradyrhizobium cosmicum]